MPRRCPNCKSVNIRRSSQREDSAQPWLRSPYRCRDCHTQFWALSTTVYRRAILIIAVNVVFFGLMVAYLLLAQR